LIYKKIIGENCYSVEQFNGVQWSIRSNVLGKNGVHDASAILSMKVKSYANKNGEISFDLAKTDL
jgi:hypothetical protein